jgi:hypothetical protein
MGGLGFAIFLGVLAIRLAWVLRRNREPEREQAPRTREGPQVVGFPCAKCKERIIFDGEAAPCTECGKPIHLRCMPHAHDDGATPYRS